MYPAVRRRLIRRALSLLLPEYPRSTSRDVAARVIRVARATPETEGMVGQEVTAVQLLCTPIPMQTVATCLVQHQVAREDKEARVIAVLGQRVIRALQELPGTQEGHLRR